MNISFEVMSAELSAPEGWNFADRPYGLEPLILPPVPGPEEAGERLRLDTTAGLDARVLCPTLLAHVDSPVSVGTQSGTDEPNIRIYWFRWITGHQISFVIWRLLLQEMRTAASTDGVRRDQALAAMSAYVHGYCAMLLYTASCSREVYEGLIRPSMFLAHPAFSGTWAPDFTAVRHVLRGRQLSWLGEEKAVAELHRGIALSRLIHSGVAAKLVPVGGSLLQKASVPGLKHPELLGVLFDTYFMTVRKPGCGDQAVPQLLRRLEAVTLDLAASGLTTRRNDDRRPSELRDDRLLEVERDVINTLLRVAEHAAGLVLNDLDQQPQPV
jgi:hypothetical protein